MHGISVLRAVCLAAGCSVLLWVCRGAQAGDCSVTPSVVWKNGIVFPDDDFRAESPVFGEPGWVKFTVLSCDPQTVYYQDSQAFEFHYEFATQALDPFAGYSLQQFNNATLYNATREAWLGAVIMPELVGFVPPAAAFPEYGIQLIGADPIPILEVIDLFEAVRSSVTADPGVQALYFPTFEQLQTALDNADLLAANGIEIASAARWSSGNNCYSHGWALGRLKFFAAGDIDAAFLSGQLLPEDILLTDGVPASIPLVAGVVTLSPATPNSHVAILANTFQVPFVYLANPADAQQAQALAGRRIVLRSYEHLFGFGTAACRADLIDVEDELSAEQIDELLALKIPLPLDLDAVAPLGSYSANTNGLTTADVQHFGGKASNYGTLRRSIPSYSPVATALSFDLWTQFLDQTLAGGMTLRETIDGLLSPYTFPPANMQALADDLEAIRDMISDDAVTAFTPAQQAAIFATLQDPQYGFDINENIRFRSSTNVEDTAQFTGAGLYDSVSGCLPDDLDGDDDGPSLCDPTENGERGVLRAIRRVFRSFYLENAYLERLRHGVDESEVGMAVLVHHSFPDTIELANGVATYTQDPPLFSTITLVSQLGANPVTEPEPGQIPEVVEVSIFSNQFFASLVSSSNLVLLGDTVMDFAADYIALSELLHTAAGQFAAESGKTHFVLDFEYKKAAPGGAAIPGGGLVVKQIREIPQPDETPEIMPFLVNDPTPYRVVQGGLGTVFTNHRLKAEWLQQTHSLWLDPEDLAGQTIFAQTDIDYFDGCGPATLAGDMSSFPGFARSFTAGTETVTWDMPGDPAGRHLSLAVDGLGTLVSAAESPIRILGDYGSADLGAVVLSATYDQPVLSIADFDNTLTTVSDEQTYLAPQFTDTADDQFFTHVFIGEDPPSTITTSFYLHPVPGVCAGCIYPLSGWEQTVIEGLTSDPMVLTSDLAQSYDAGQHNFLEWFLFEPALDPGVSAAQRSELSAQGIDLILALKTFGENTVTYIQSDAECECTHFGGCADLDADGIRDDACAFFVCDAGTCTGITRQAGQADIGGFAGACAIDGACDINDAFHALNCFANQTTSGMAGYPCESAPPSALNVDAGGLAGTCALDGVCDINDRFAANNCFADVGPSGTSPYPCTCGGPAPAQPGAAGIREAIVTWTDLALRAPADVRPGEVFAVEVYTTDELEALRGYQLHIEARGGTRGGLELLDIAVDAQRSDHAFNAAQDAPWLAYNRESRQMLAGVDRAVRDVPGAAYLATYTYRASPDAAGDMVIQILHNDHDPAPRERTFLFADPYHLIAVRGAPPAVVHVAGSRRQRAGAR